MKTAIRIGIVLAFLHSVSAELPAQQVTAPEQLGARLLRAAQQVREQLRADRQQLLHAPDARIVLRKEADHPAHAGQSAEPVWLDLVSPAKKEDPLKILGEKAIAPRFGIDMLNRKVAREKLDRRLFGMPWGTAMFSAISRDKSGEIAATMYVQIVSDILWNRLVYGDYDKFIRAYDAGETGKRLNRPSGVVVDHRGRVFVADAGNSRILELAFTGAEDDLRLRHVRTLQSPALSQPVELAVDDRGTPFQADDDLLWVIDSGNRSVLAFPLSGDAFAPVAQRRFDLPPVALAAGRVAGVNDGTIYLATHNGRTIERYILQQGEIIPVARLRHDEAMLISSLATDFSGSLYAADQAQRRLLVFSPELVLLSEHKSSDQPLRPVRLQTLTGIETTVGETPRVIGFDQVFLLEEWTRESGARRFAVLPDARVQAVRITPDLDQLSVSGVISEPAQVKIEFRHKDRRQSFTLIPDKPLDSGPFALSVDRAEFPGFGVFELVLHMQTLSGMQSIHELDQRFYVPYYRRIDFSAEAPAGIAVLQGVRDSGAGAAVLRDPQVVRVRIGNLLPDRRQELRLLFAPDDDPVSVRLLIDGDVVGDDISIEGKSRFSDWLALPERAEKVELEIRRSSGLGQLKVQQIEVRERDFVPGALAEEESALPQRYALFQNYPNPFNPSTTIRYRIPTGATGKVSLIIYDMLGRQVRQLVNHEQPPGEYQQVWDGRADNGSEVGSGLYFYTLHAGQFKSTRKMVLVR